MRMLRIVKWAGTGLLAACGGPSRVIWRYSLTCYDRIYLAVVVGLVW